MSLLVRGALAVSGLGGFVSLGRMTVSFLGVLLRSRGVAFFVMLGCRMVRLGSRLVMLGGFLVGCLSHDLLRYGH